MHGKASESTQIADERLARFDRGREEVEHLGSCREPATLFLGAENEGRLEEEQIHREHVTVLALAAPKKTDRVVLEGHRRPEQGETLFDVRR